MTKKSVSNGKQPGSEVNGKNECTVDNKHEEGIRRQMDRPDTDKRSQRNGKAKKIKEQQKREDKLQLVNIENQR